MKAVILAGGYGTRITEETYLKPKPMIEIGGNPILWHIMKTYSHYGINDFVICCGYKGYMIKEYFANYFLHMSDVTFNLKNNKMEVHHKFAEPWTVTLSDTGLDTMTGGRLKRIKEYVKDESFCFTYGDGVSDVDISASIQFHKSHGKTVTFTGVHPSGRFGEFQEKNNQVYSFEEKPDKGKAFINGGYMVFNNNLLNYLTSDESCDFEFNALEKLAKSGEVMVYKHEGNWACMDHERDVLHLNQLWSDERAFWKKWK